MKIKSLKTSSFSKKKRNFKEIKVIIIHYTGMQSTRVALKRLTNDKHKVSCHYFIDRNGEISQIVADNRIAWHAGKSKWGKLENLNKKSIGIELVNKGHKFGYQKFPKKQINALIRLCTKLKNKYKINKNLFLGHSDIAPLRKSDPGEKFPWLKLKNKKIGIWHSSSKKKLLSKNFKRENLRKMFFKNIHKIGYRYFSINRPSKNDTMIIKAFQRRFRQRKIDGIIDIECLKISSNLAKKQ
jgi:N-acetylmuramoyl-L-alanine amidase